MRWCALKAFKTLDSRGMSDVKSPETWNTFSASISGTNERRKIKQQQQQHEKLCGLRCWVGGRSGIAWVANERSERERAMVHGYFMARG